MAKVLPVTRPLRFWSTFSEIIINRLLTRLSPVGEWQMCVNVLQNNIKAGLEFEPSTLRLRGRGKEPLNHDTPPTLLKNRSVSRINFESAWSWFDWWISQTAIRVQILLNCSSRGNVIFQSVWSRSRWCNWGIIRLSLVEQIIFWLHELKRIYVIQVALPLLKVGLMAIDHFAMIAAHRTQWLRLDFGIIFNHILYEHWIV